MQIRSVFGAIGIALFAAHSFSFADIYTTSFDGYSAGFLTGQDSWVAQNQWVADGAGNVVNQATNAPPTNAGAFVRAHNTSVLGSTAIGETMRLNTSFTLGAFTAPSNDIADFEEGILQLGMSHQQGNATFSYGLAAGLYYESSNGELQFRVGQAGSPTGTTLVSLGAASGFGSADLTMETIFTKIGADSWQVDATVANGGGTLGTLSFTASGLTGDLDSDSDGGGIIGGFQGLPSGGGSPGVATPPFGATTIRDFTIEVSSVPEPSSFAILCLVPLATCFRGRRSA